MRPCTRPIVRRHSSCTSGRNTSHRKTYVERGYRWIDFVGPNDMRSFLRCPNFSMWSMVRLFSDQWILRITRRKGTVADAMSKFLGKIFQVKKLVRLALFRINRFQHQFCLIHRSRMSGRVFLADWPVFLFFRSWRPDISAERSGSAIQKNIDVAASENFSKSSATSMCWSAASELSQQ